MKLIRLIGMMLVVFVKKELQEHVSDIAACTVGTGILGKMVCLSFCLDLLMKRNLNIFEILQNQI